LKTAVAATRATESAAAGKDLGEQVRETLGCAPAAIILFAAPNYDHKTLLGALRESCDGCVVVGASSAGEFMNELQGDGLACVLALGGDGAEFRATVGRGVQADPEGAARQLAAGFTGLSDLRPVNRAALVMTDALAGHADILVDELTLATAGQYRFFGGGAGDNAQFQRTTVFCGDEVLTDAVVALEILSEKPIGVGVSHGWKPASAGLRVTDADGMRLIGLNGLPAVEAFQAHAEETGQTLETAAPIPFFLHNILGIETPAGHRLRVPLAVEADGSVLCAAEVPVGSVVRVMRSSHQSTVEAAQAATDAAVAALGGHPPGAALFFDCVATRLRMGEGFGSEVAAVKAQLGGIDLAGCNTHGQIARAEGQFQGFHNCTAVVCVLPE
jgi:hypothetical protein